MIRLGFCFDLLDPYNVEYLSQLHASYAEAEEAAGRTLPRNANHRKFLDCAVFEYAYTAHEREHQRTIDTSRAVYVPSGGDYRVWERSWISKGSHIQICVRNTACIMGTWLHSTQGTITHG
jgi:hypothetical protein